MSLATYISKCNGNIQHFIITPVTAIEQLTFLKVKTWIPSLGYQVT